MLKLVKCNMMQSVKKSALLTAAKKAKLKSNPSRVRFAEGVVINGSSCYPSSFDSCVPFMPNVLKVFLENGQTKTFKYDNTTLVQVCSCYSLMLIDPPDVIVTCFSSTHLS